MPTTPSSDPHVPYLVSVTATRAELDSLSDAVADAVDGWREDGDARLVLAADRISSLMDRIKRSWRTESTQHAATPPTGQPAPGTWSLSGVDDDCIEPCGSCGQDTHVQRDCRRYR